MSNLDDTMGWGVVCALCACGCSTLSKVIWRYAHNATDRQSLLGGKEPAAAAAAPPLGFGATAAAEEGGDEVPQCGGFDESRVEFPRRCWAGGALLMLPSGLLYCAAFALASQSLVSCISGLSTLFNLLLAPLILGEKWSRSDVLGVLLVIGGCVGVGLTSESQPHPSYSFRQMLGMFRSRRFIEFAFVGARARRPRRLPAPPCPALLCLALPCPALPCPMLARPAPFETGPATRNPLPRPEAPSDAAFVRCSGWLLDGRLAAAVAPAAGSTGAWRRGGGGGGGGGGG
eukprot:SAG22_NODE_954_length_6332_cov_4.111343_1_plen_287_part_10